MHDSIVMTCMPTGMHSQHCSKLKGKDLHECLLACALFQPMQLPNFCDALPNSIHGLNDICVWLMV